MSGSLANFVPTIMNNAGRIATRLDLFRTNTLASFEPAEERKDAANAELDHLLDTTVDLEDFVIPDIPVVNTRAGLYIYLNAAVRDLELLPLPSEACSFSHAVLP